MPNLPSLVEMLQSGVHFGHKTSRWHPKMQEYIFGSRSGIHIVDLETTQKHLEKALEYVKGIAARGGKVLFVGTKPQAKELVAMYATECNMPYVNERWLGGTLTNFGQIKKTLKELRQLKEQRDKGELRKYTKKEQLLISRQIEEMERKFGGIQTVEKVPEAIFVIDIKTEKTAVDEAATIGTKVIALCDTNVNPAKVDYVIPGNDDAIKSIDLFSRLVKEAIKEGLDHPVKVVEEQKTKEQKVKRLVKPNKNKEE
ncbi:30S ribosomal protein S2 [Patescibacteria group bacterium]